MGGEARHHALRQTEDRVGSVGRTGGHGGQLLVSTCRQSDCTAPLPRHVELTHTATVGARHGAQVCAGLEDTVAPAHTGTNYVVETSTMTLHTFLFFHRDQLIPCVVPPSHHQAALLLTVFVVRRGRPQSEGRGVAEPRVRHVGRRAAAVQLVCLGQLLQHHQSSVSSNTPGAILRQEFLSKI